uniref:Integrase catalytic domain-containing protein n=1 Tax=Steinernema glaseri TaxID=37863 RepID=A0A1I7ZCY5_9BILA
MERAFTTVVQKRNKTVQCDLLRSIVYVVFSDERSAFVNPRISASLQPAIPCQNKISPEAFPHNMDPIKRQSCAADADCPMPSEILACSQELLS